MSVMAGLELEYQERQLLEGLYEKTKPGVYHRHELDHASFEEVAQDSGLASVGNIDTRMMNAAREFKHLAAKGYVEAVKDPTGGALRYRVTQLGERVILSGRIRHLERELDKQNRAWHEEYARRTWFEGQLVIAQAELAAYKELPWWRRAFGSPNTVEQLKKMNEKEA